MSWFGHGLVAYLLEASVLRSVAAFVLVAVVPGFVAVRLARARRPDLGAEPALAIGVLLGLTSWVLVAETLVRAGALTSGPLWVACFAVAAASIAVAVADRQRRFSPASAQPRSPSKRRTALTRSLCAADGWEDVDDPRNHLRRPEPVAPAQKWSAARRALRAAIPWLVAVITAMPQAILILSRPDSFIGPTPWYYWFVSRSIAVAGRTPSNLFEWGEPVGTFTFHFGFNSSTAFLSVAGGDLTSLAPAHGVRLLAALLFGLGVWTLTRSLGASEISAAATTVLAHASQIYLIKLSSYRPESLAYGFAFLSVALAISGLRARDRLLLLASVVGIAGLNQVHGLSATFAVAMLAGVAVAILLAGPVSAGSRRERIVLLGTFAATAAVGSVLINLVMTGRFTAADAANGLPNLASGGYDATWAFARLVSAARGIEASAGVGAPTNGELVRHSLEATIAGAPSWYVNCLAAVAVGGLLVLSIRSKRSRELGLFALITFGSMVVISYLVSKTGETYVPRRTGFSRLLQLWPVLPPIVIGALVGHVKGRFAHTVATAAFGITTLLVAVHAVPLVLASQSGQPSRSAIHTVESLPIDKGAVVLANAYTQDYLTVLTPGRGLSDGHAPYLERDLLDRANTILLLARSYFKNPTTSPFPFARYGVRYVLAAKQPFLLGTPANFYRANSAALSRDPRLTLIIQDPMLVLYRVNGS